MIATRTSPPPLVLLLADHLDAVLAAGEDILKLEVDIEAARKADGATGPWERFGDVVSQAKLYELTIVSRVLQARNRCAELQREIGRDSAAIAALLGLFASGTAVLEEAVAELANRAAADFDSGLDPLAYLRTRGVMPGDAGSLAGLSRLAMGEGFLVARRIELGPLLDMSAALLDALDVAYSLFEDTVEATLVRDGGLAAAVADGESVQP
jgi:hypothetical protein